MAFQLIMKNEKSFSVKTTAPKYPHLIRNMFYDDGKYIDYPLDYEFIKYFLIEYCNFKDNDDFIKEFYNTKYVPIVKDYKYLEGDKASLFKISNLFGIYSNTKLKREYWLDRGYTDEDFNAFMQVRQNTAVHKKQRYIDMYGEEDGLAKFHEDNKLNAQKSVAKHKKNYANNKEYPYSKTINPATGKFYTYEESLEMNRINAKLASAAAVKTFKKRPCSVFQKEYWINLGLDESTAIQEVYNRMAHNGLKYYIQKYGIEEGTLKYNARIEKYKATCNNKSAEEKIAWNRKKYVPKLKISKASISFFEKCLTALSDIGLSVNEAIYGDSEYHLVDVEMNTIYFYDFYDKDDNLLIEYHGIMFHPKYNKMTNDELSNWRSLYYNIDGITQAKKDQRKETLANMLGYNFLIIWEDDDPQKSIDAVINKIKQLRNVN